MLKKHMGGQVGGQQTEQDMYGLYEAEPALQNLAWESAMLRSFIEINSPSSWWILTESVLILNKVNVVICKPSKKE